jgi:hypothetical protein
MGSPVPGEQSAVQAGQGQQKPLRVPTRCRPGKARPGSGEPRRRRRGSPAQAAQGGLHRACGGGPGPDGGHHRDSDRQMSREPGGITEPNLCPAGPGITHISLSRLALACAAQAAFRKCRIDSGRPRWVSGLSGIPAASRVTGPPQGSVRARTTAGSGDTGRRTRPPGSSTAPGRARSTAQTHRLAAAPGASAATPGGRP